jgi:hypothetical protein
MPIASPPILMKDENLFFIRLRQAVLKYVLNIQVILIIFSDCRRHTYRSPEKRPTGVPIPKAFAGEGFRN